MDLKVKVLNKFLSFATAMRTTELRHIGEIFTLLITLSGLWSSAYGGSESYGTFLAEKLSRNSVVFLGEWHAVDGHRESTLDILPALIAHRLVDSIAVEFIDHEQDDLFQRYVADSTALPGSEREMEYLQCFSESARSEAVFGKCKEGGWRSVLSAPSIAMMQYLRLQSQMRNIKVCGIDYDDHYEGSGRTPELDYQKLSIEYRKYAEKVYSGHLNPVSSGIVRELYIAKNISECISSGKKTLVLLGGFHASKNISVGPFTFSIVKNFNPKIKMVTGMQVSPPNDNAWARLLMGSEVNYWLSNAPYISDDFIQESITEDVKAIETSSLPENLKIQLGKTLNNYDFYVFGQPSPNNGQ